VIVPRDFMARIDALIGGDNSRADLRERIDAATALYDELFALAWDLYRDRAWTRAAPE
jgi:hypothetical protein